VGEMKAATEALKKQEALTASMAKELTSTDAAVCDIVCMMM